MSSLIGWAYTHNDPWSMLATRTPLLDILVVIFLRAISWTFLVIVFWCKCNLYLTFLHRLLQIIQHLQHGTGDHNLNNVACNECQVMNKAHIVVYSWMYWNKSVFVIFHVAYKVYSYMFAFHILQRHCVKWVKFRVSGHFLDNAWREWLEILYVDVSWPPS